MKNKIAILTVIVLCLTACGVKYPVDKDTGAEKSFYESCYFELYDEKFEVKPLKCMEMSYSFTRLDKSGEDMASLIYGCHYVSQVQETDLEGLYTWYIERYDGTAEDIAGKNKVYDLGDKQGFLKWDDERKVFDYVLVDGKFRYMTRFSGEQSEDAMVAAVVDSVQYVLLEHYGYEGLLKALSDSIRVL